MKTTYPFEIPAAVAESIPRAHRDGNAYSDVKFRGQWDGILVINADRQCIGVYVRRQIIEWPLPFTPDQIEDLRPASIWNRMLANLPAGLDPYGIAVLTIWIACPALLILGLTTTIWLLPALLAVVFICIAVMYSVRGFPFTRFPTLLFGLGILIAALISFAIKWFA